MLFFIGLFTVFGSVLYGYVMSNGELLALWHPFEFLIIIGGAFGAFLLSNPWHLITECFKLMPQVMFGSKVNKAMYMDVLGLIYDILNKARREGIMSIEGDVDSPKSSALFARYPAIQGNSELAEFIADYFRIIAAGNLTPYELEALMDQEIEARLHELEAPGDAVGRVADALPGFGIVAAVLGIVITMGAIDGEITEVGGSIAAALVGTFSGVFLAYGMVGPVSAKMRHIADEEIKLYESVKACVIASLNGLPPQLAVEFGRKALFTQSRPSFNEVESKVRGR
ncbi:flagellar motor protein MotA [Bacterioplanes sanyensis]|uniref:flagellar motor stator protein MotA n=1 Tax=Bacterioplanes sanyensis TaxID=1249553 RepID=UPI001678E247|nr:flagellar motor stator protein MotA [Bacterioplanes sanyensis]GGY46477.1 flagellar motor protein MotA [Bacterioplanes sanyensis]